MRQMKLGSALLLILLIGVLMAFVFEHRRAAMRLALAERAAAVAADRAALAQQRALAQRARANAATQAAPTHNGGKR